MRKQIKTKFLQRTNRTNMVEDRTNLDEELHDPAYWKDPDNQHIGFQRFEDLMKELRTDYDKECKTVSAQILITCNNSGLDKNLSIK